MFFIRKIDHSENTEETKRNVIGNMYIFGYKYWRYMKVLLKKKQNNTRQNDILLYVWFGTFL